MARDLRDEIRYRLDSYKTRVNYLKNRKKEESSLSTGYERGYVTGEIDSLLNVIDVLEYTLRVTTKNG